MESDIVRERRESFEHRGFVPKHKIRNFLCTNRIRNLIFLVLFALVVPILIYYLVVDQGEYTEASLDTCLVEPGYRISCGYVNISEVSCMNLDCCFDAVNGSCYHYLPSKYAYLSDNDKYSPSHVKTTVNTSSISELSISVRGGDEHVVIMLHDDTIKSNTAPLLPATKYAIKTGGDKLQVDVARQSPDAPILLSTSRGPLMASDKYWEWSLYLGSDLVFGLDGESINLKGNETVSKVVYKSGNNMDLLPILWAYKNNSFHAIEIRHDGPLEVIVLASGMMVLRMIGGHWMEVWVYIGPSPQELHKQLLNVGKDMDSSSGVPFWTLKPHICRSGSSIISDTDLVNFDGNQRYFESDCIHENLFMYILKKGNLDLVQEAIQRLKANDKRFIMSVQPQIPSSSDLSQIADQLGVLYKNDDGIYEGKFLKQQVVYPDYRNGLIGDFLENVKSLLNASVGLENIDGISLIKNWPYNEIVEKINEKDFPYLPDNMEEALLNTLPWDSFTNSSDSSTYHIFNHNKYGAFHAEQFKTKFPNMLLMSTSTEFEQNLPVLQDDVDISWSNMKSYLNNVLFQSISGNHLVSVPVCGSTAVYDKELQEQLCLRWYIIAGTMPLLRVSSLPEYRNPENLNSIFTVEIVGDVISKRNQLLPYYYEILTRGEPLVRPMWYDYYQESITLTLDEQYMVGERVLVAHPFTSGRDKLRVYLPLKVGIWYEFWGGMAWDVRDTDGMVDVVALKTDWISFVAQGTVIPLQDDDEFNLIVAMDCTETPCVSEGLYMDQLNNTVSFRMEGDILTISEDLGLNLKKIMWYKPNEAFVCVINGTNLQHKLTIDMSKDDSVDCYK